MPSSMPRTKSSARRISARHSTVARSMPRANRASAVSRDLAAGRVRAQAGVLAPRANSNLSASGLKASRAAPGAELAALPVVRAAPALAVSKTFCARRSAARAGAEPVPRSSPRISGAGANVAASLTVSLPDAAQGVTQRVRLPSGKDVEVKIPAGIANGQQVRLRGQGMRGSGGAGDLLISVSIAPHPIFTLDGADIRLDLPVTLYEAALGAKVRVPTLDRPVELTIPPGTSSGRTFRLKGKGFPAKEGRGDLLAAIRIMLPEKIDSDFEALMKKWRTEKPYNPR